MSSSDALPVSRFYIMIDESTKAFFTEMSGLQIETDVFEYIEGGNNRFVHRLPGITKFSNLTFKKGFSANNEMFKWYMDIVNGKIDRRNLSVVMYNVNGEQITRWEFINAYPVKWIGPPLDAAGNSAAVETLELAHDGMQVI